MKTKYLELEGEKIAIPAELSVEGFAKKIKITLKFMLKNNLTENVEMIEKYERWVLKLKNAGF